MGMFDDVQIRDDDRFVCSQGHRTEHLQTKEFECELNWIVVADGKLTTDEGPGDFERTTPPFDADIYTGTFEAYGFCGSCEVVRSNKDGSNRRVAREAWIEFRVTAKDGRVVAVERISPPTGG